MPKSSKRSSTQPINLSEAARVIHRGGVGVILTDTIYGLVCSAFNKKAVERIFRLKGRSSRKPLIVLVSSAAEMRRFGVRLLKGQRAAVLGLWKQKPTSVILPAPSPKLSYIHRGTGSIAFRMPRDARLRRFLKISGPVVAPSANPEGQPPAATIEEAIGYFGKKTDFYVDGGRRKARPSRLVRIGDKIEILRK